MYDTGTPLQFLTQFEAEVYSKIAKVFVMHHIKLTVDDDLLASRSASVAKKNINNRKRGREGMKSDGICDAFLNTVVGYKHARRLDCVTQSQVEDVLRSTFTAANIGDKSAITNNCR